MEKYSFIVDKSSPRLCIVSDSLLKKGYEVNEYGKNIRRDEKKRYVYLFSPAKKLTDEEEKDLFGGSVVIGGKNFRPKRKDVTCEGSIDERYIYFNNLITAEGTLEICIHNTEKALYTQNVLIIGYGRLGKVLKNVFSPLCKSVSICTFDKSKTNPVGGEVIYFEKSFLSVAKDFDIVLNTAPKELFSKEELKYFDKDCLFVELASVHCILDENIEYAEFSYLPSPRLPDKTAPETAAEEYEKHIFSILGT